MSNYMSDQINKAGRKAMGYDPRDEDDEEEKAKKASWFSKIKKMLGYGTSPDQIASN
jgi:hypothetical protein